VQQDPYEGKRTNSRLVTVFTTWNAMVGLGLITIPWAYAEAGLLLGLFITVFQYVTSSYTCWMCLHSAGKDVDYTDTVNKYFGRKGWITGMIVFIVNLLVPIIIYIQLLAQTLYPNLLVLSNIGSDNPRVLDPDTFKKINFSEMSYSWTCIIVFFGVFIVTMRKDLAIFIKLNFFGAWMIFVVIAMVLGYGIVAFGNTEYKFVTGKPPI